MALTDAVPSDSLDVLKRNAEDLDKALNSTSNFTNRVGDTLVPVPSALSQIATAVTSALSSISLSEQSVEDAATVAINTSIPAEVSLVESARINAESDISNKVLGVDSLASSAATDINSDVAIVESERTSSIVAIDGYVNEVQGKSADTISEMNSFLGSAQAARDNAFIDIQSDVDDVEQAKNLALQDSIPAKINELGLKYPPLAYAPGLTLNDYTQTYSYNDAIYIWGGELGTVTSGAFDEVNWSIVQKDLSGYVDSYSNTVEMESLSPTQTGQRAENRERANAQYILSSSGYTASPGDIVAANGRVWKLLLENGAYLSFFDSLEDAADRCSNDGINEVHIKGNSYNVPDETDMKGVGITGSNLSLSNQRRLLNCGPLKGCVVDGHRTDVDYISPIDIAAGKTTKALLRLNDGSTDEVHVITKSAVKGYTFFTHSYNLFGTGSTDTAGASENWRSTYIKKLADCYVMKRTPSEEINGWDDFADIRWDYAFGSGVNDGVRLQYKAAQRSTSEITYTVNSNKIGRRGFAAFYCSSSSTENAEILVNGVSQRNFSTRLVDDNYVILVEYELTQIGENAITIDKPGSGQLYVIGVEFSTLEDADPSSEYDYLCYGFYPLSYVDSTGAQDYAIFCKDDQKWIGSYHGGETERESAVFNVDGVKYPVPTNDGDFILGESIRIEQSTTLAVGSNSLDCDSVWYYTNDSVQGFDCTMSGSAKAEFFYTTMTTTNDDFDDVQYPIKVDVASGSVSLGRYNKVVQANESQNYPMRLTTYFTLFPMGGDLGINADRNGVRVFGSEDRYNKVYYGPLTNSEATITNIGFSNVKVFD